MFTPRRAILSTSLLLAIGAGAALAETPNLGKPIDEAAIAAWDISILPDGTGLPKGSGTPAQGAVIYAEKCVACHGDNGKGGGPAAALVSDQKITGISAAQKTIKNFWPYSTTVFDFVRRAMPFDAPQSLTPDQVYAVCAYVLYLNKLVPQDAVLDAQTLPKIEMPNRSHFVSAFTSRPSGPAP